MIGENKKPMRVIKKAIATILFFGRFCYNGIKTKFCSYKYSVNENCVHHDHQTQVYCLLHDLDCEKGMENAEKMDDVFFFDFDIVKIIVYVRKK